MRMWIHILANMTILVLYVRRADPLWQDTEDNYGKVTGYLAKRRQFAVENDDDVQHYRNPNYQ